MKKITILILLLSTVVGCSSSKLQTTPNLKTAYRHILELDSSDHSSLNINYLKQYLSDINCEEIEIDYFRYEPNPYFNKNSVIALKYKDNSGTLEIMFDKESNNVFEMIYSNNIRGKQASSIYASNYYIPETPSSSEYHSFFFNLEKTTSNSQEHLNILKYAKKYTSNDDFDAYLTIFKKLNSKQSLALSQLEKIIGYKHIEISEYEPNYVDYYFNNITLRFFNGELDTVMYSSSNDRYYAFSSINCDKNTLFNNNIYFTSTFSLNKADDLLNVLPTLYNKYF